MNITSDVTTITYNKLNGSQVRKQFGNNKKGKKELKKTLEFLKKHEIPFTEKSETITIKRNVIDY